MLIEYSALLIYCKHALQCVCLFSILIHFVGRRPCNANSIRKHLTFVPKKNKTLNPLLVRAGGSNLCDDEVYNSAFVFIKPHANTEAVQSLVKNKLQDSGISILDEFDITGDVIDKEKLIDQHYYAIASKATILSPREMSVPEAKFEVRKHQHVCFLISSFSKQKKFFLSICSLTLDTIVCMFSIIGVFW